VKTNLELAETCLIEIHMTRLHFKELASSLSFFAQSILIAQERHIMMPNFPELSFEDQQSMAVQVAILEAVLNKSQTTIDGLETKP